ncbi:unnamed protein product [Spirodela intermedia]|uniref:Uncharacterized protein n=1 Tax=Spirodela intermedia TaxID=51605 RepID=A0A7I8J9I7_SPIIN|nr:unnamed protein product [Spirodela intermedia]CAA6666759.1 unnamed protein product [Spirodela intermedia]
MSSSSSSPVLATSLSRTPSSDACPARPRVSSPPSSRSTPTPVSPTAPHPPSATCSGTRGAAPARGTSIASSPPSRHGPTTSPPPSTSLGPRRHGRSLRRSLPQRPHRGLLPDRQAEHRLRPVQQNVQERPHPDVESYRLLMQGLCRKSQVTSAVDLLEDMLNKGYVPDALSYSTLLNSLCRKKRLREAYKLLCRMKVKGCNPDIVHYNTLLDDMSDNGCFPSLLTYTTLVNGLCSRGLTEEGSHYLQDMISKGLVPHFSVFHALVKGFCAVGKYGEACDVLAEMLNLGVAPHVETWAVLLPGVCDDDGETSMAAAKRVVMEDGWRRATRIVQAGPELEEYMAHRSPGRGVLSGTMHFVGNRNSQSVRPPLHRSTGPEKGSNIFRVPTL